MYVCVIVDPVPENPSPKFQVQVTGPGTPPNDELVNVTEEPGQIVVSLAVKETVGGDIFRINTELLKVLKDLGEYTPENIKFIAENKGSVQKCDFIPQHLKDVFRNAFEIDMKAHLDLCSQRQPYIDQQQSINLYFSSSDSPQYIAECHKQALLDDMTNGLYSVILVAVATMNALVALIVNKEIK